MQGATTQILMIAVACFMVMGILALVKGPVSTGVNNAVQSVFSTQGGGDAFSDTGNAIFNIEE